MAKTEDTICHICSNGNLVAPDCAHSKLPLVKPSFHICTNCAFVSVKNGKKNAPANMKPAARLGTESVAGRNFEMARMGAMICQQYDLSLGIHQAGVTQDGERILNIPMISSVASIETASNAVGLGQKNMIGQQKYDVILMNETLQTIDNKADVIALLGDLKDDGICIASTDLNIGDGLDGSKFIEAATTRSMWSGKSLALCASEAGTHIDFRVPLLAVKKRYMRKRYALFYKSPKIENSIRLFFSKTPHAPSEPAK